jgi:hypothetical protein
MIQSKKGLNLEEKAKQEALEQDIYWENYDTKESLEAETIEY